MRLRSPGNLPRLHVQCHFRITLTSYRLRRGCPMRMQQTVRFWIFLLTAIPALCLVADGGRVLNAQVFSVDPASPLAVLPGGSPANLYRPGGAVYAPATSIGLLAGDNIDAFSFGFDTVVAVTPMGFSTGFFTSGAIVAGNAVCSEAGLCPPAVPCPPEPMADLFSSMA